MPRYIPPGVRDLLEIKQAFDENRMPCVDTRKRIAERIDSILAGVDPAHALGLRASHFSRTEVTTWKHARRNRWLLEAHSLCAGSTSWQKSIELVDQVKRLRDGWRKYEHLDDPPTHFNDLRRALFNAMKIGLPIPETPARFQQIVKQESDSNFTDTG